MTIPPALQQLIDQNRARFLALSQRERLIVLVGGSLLLITLFYIGLIEPVIKAHRNRVEALASSRAVATQLEAAAAVVSSSQAGAITQGAGVSLLAAVDQSTRSSALGKAPERLQPEGENEVKIWFEDVSFDNLSRWLAELHTAYGIKVQTMDVEIQDKPGAVDARLSLTRG